MVQTTQLRTVNPLNRPWRQDVQPVKPSFWEGLDEQEKKASVDQQKSWQFRNKFAWGPAGQVKDQWSTYIWPRVLKPLLQDNTRKVFRGRKNHILYSIACWMVGTNWNLSHPAAVISCGNEKVTKNIVRLIERHGQLSEWGFCVYGYQNQISLTMAKLSDSSQLLGTKFLAGNPGDISDRVATIGGAVVIDEQYFCLTVLHPFIEIDQGDTDAEDSDSISDDSASEVSCEGLDFNLSSPAACPSVEISQETVELKYNTAFHLDSYPESTILGSISATLDSSYYSQRMDWALLNPNLAQDNTLDNSIYLDEKLFVPSKVSTEFPTGHLWAISSQKSPKKISVSSCVCGLFLPGSGLQDVWALDLYPDQGNCGSWVVDPDNNCLFAIIVAGVEQSGTTYALPAREVFCSIKERFPGMNIEFPQLKSDDSNLSQATEHAEAQAMHRQDLEGGEKVFGREHSDALSIVRSLGPVLLSQEKYQEMEAMHQRDYVVELEHPDTLASVSQFGNVLSSQGKYEEAETIHRHALAGREKVLGLEHLDTLASISHLGNVLSNQWKYGEAETMYRRALAGSEKVLGREHPNTLASVSQLGNMLSSQKKYKEAETMCRRALEESEKVFGREHPNTLASFSHLGNVLSSQGKHEEVETMYRRALEESEEKLGREHSHTLIIVDSLAYILSIQGKHEEAETLHQRALEADMKMQKLFIDGN